MKATAVERFWSKICKTDACWNWTASKREKGYGAFVWAENDLIVQGRAHRFSWILHNGAIPNGLCVLHRCDNPACVRPDHLFLGTKAENNEDMRRKGRAVSGGKKCGSNGKYRRGLNHWNCKITPEIAVQVKQLKASGLSYSQLAANFGIGQTTAWKIVKQKTWKNS